MIFNYTISSTLSLIIISLILIALSLFVVFFTKVEPEEKNKRKKAASS